MELNMEIERALWDINKDVCNLLDSDAGMRDFWKNELVADVASYNGAIQSLFRQFDASSDHRMLILFKSIELESQSLLRVVTMLECLDGSRTQAIRITRVDLRRHLTRFMIKGGYLVRHLSEFLQRDELECLGADFSVERSVLAERVHTMAFGG